jgi:hypothetical protein
MPGRPISKTTADSLIAEYISYMTNLGVDMNKQTQSVSFTATTVMKWLDRKLAEGADELKVFMGLYPPGHTQAGHTTVILWPYKDGQPFKGGALSLGAAKLEGGGEGEEEGTDDAFNEGTGTP